MNDSELRPRRITDDARFRTNVDEVARDVWLTGKFPRQNSKAGRFLANVRRAARGVEGGMRIDAERRAYLDAHIPGWETPGHDANFRQRVVEYAKFVQWQGRRPMMSSTDRHEKSLATFMHNVRSSIDGPRNVRLDDERRRLLDAHVPGWDDSRADARFRDQAHAYSGFVRSHARRPRLKAPDRAERSLAVFMKHVRAAANGTGEMRLVGKRRAILDELVPGWEGSPADARFRQRVLDYADFVATRGFPPRRRAEDATEQGLRSWLNNVRAAKAGTGTMSLNSERYDLLDEHIPGWSGRTGEGQASPSRMLDQPDADAPRLKPSNTKFRGRAAACGAFVTVHGRRPSSRSKDPAESSLGRFLDRARDGGHLTGHPGADRERQMLLDEHVPGWDDADAKVRDRTLSYNSARFHDNVQAVAAFRRVNGRDPLRGAMHTEERRLARFLAAARSGEHGVGDMPIDWRRRQLLDEHLPGWNKPSGHGPNSASRRDETFIRKAEFCARFVAEHGHLPRSHAKTKNEQRLAWFLERARTAVRADAERDTGATLTAARRAILDANIPGWDSPASKRESAHDRAFRQNVGDFAEFVHDYGRRPSLVSPDRFEKKLAQFMNRVRAGAHGNAGGLAMNQDRIRLLDEQIPGWDVTRRGRKPRGGRVCVRNERVIDAH